MTHAVGVRTYILYVTQKGSNAFTDPLDQTMPENLASFVSNFVKKKSAVTDITAQEKNWKLTEKKSEGAGNSRGMVSYGRYGYGASIQDTKTGVERYKRKITDSEIIHLYYRFWKPDKENFIIAALSSFSGRSCITLIFEQMKQDFEIKNSGFVLKFGKLLPSGASAKVYAGKPVKNLKLITRKPSNEIADRLFSGKSPKTKKMSVTIYSGRNGSLGSFSDLINSLPADESGFIQFDGIEFDQAVATVKIGNELRPVGVFGANAEVGVIDITEDVVKDADGVPTYESLNLESSKILDAVYSTLHGKTTK